MVRDMPHAERARLVSFTGSTVILPSAKVTCTSSLARNDSSPFGPLTETVWPLTFAVTPFGTATDFLPIRDIATRSSSPKTSSPNHLEHAAEHLAADVLIAGLGIRHDALRRRQDGDAETVGDARNVLHRGVNATARPRNPLDFTNNRLTVVVLQLDFEFGAAVVEIDGR